MERSDSLHLLKILIEFEDKYYVTAIRQKAKDFYEKRSSKGNNKSRG